MKVNPLTFFNFCAAHSPLLRALAERDEEISPDEAFRLIRANPSRMDELPDTTWRVLRELQILVPTEPGGELYFLADPVARLLDYLFNQANPATPEMIRGFVDSLDTSAGRLGRALEEDDISQVKFAFEEISETLRRIYADLEETHRAIITEVARHKIARSRVSVREKFRRIVYWMERYVQPMIEIVRSDGPLRATLDEIERQLRVAREEALFSDLPALMRIQRFLRLVGVHALRVLTQCRKEIQPLYESLRRSSFIAEGAARALEMFQNDGVARSAPVTVIPVFSFRIQNVPGDAAITLALRRVIDHPPEPPPILDLTTEEEEPDSLLHRVWLDSLPGRAHEDAPIADLLRWIIEDQASYDTSQVLAGFSVLFFHSKFQARFTEAEPQKYSTSQGILEASAVELTLK